MNALGDTLLACAADNDAAVIAWHGFCVLSLRNAIPLGLVYAAYEGEESFFKQLLSYFVAALWLTLVAMGLPVSMLAIPAYRVWKNGTQIPPNAMFVARFAGLLLLQVATWAYLKHIGKDIPPIMVIVGFIEDIPNIWWETIYKTILAMIPFYLLIYLSGVCLLRYSNNNNNNWLQHRQE